MEATWLHLLSLFLPCSSAHVANSFLVILPRLKLRSFCSASLNKKSDANPKLLHNGMKRP